MGTGNGCSTLGSRACRFLLQVKYLLGKSFNKSTSKLKLSSSTSEILIERRRGWSYGPSFDIGIGSTVAVGHSNKVFIVGGYQNYDYSRVYSLDSPVSTWNHDGNLQRVRYYHSVW